MLKLRTSIQRTIEYSFHDLWNYPGKFMIRYTFDSLFHNSLDLLQLFGREAGVFNGF